MGVNGEEQADVYDESSLDLFMFGSLFPEISEPSYYVQEYDRFLGLVQNGEFRLLNPYRALNDSIKLTSRDMQEVRAPECGELDLMEYDGQVIMVSRYDGGGWIYSARVIDQAGPILTLVVLELFGQGPQK